MKLIWHIVKKDLRRFWPFLALMALALIVKAFLLSVALSLTAQTTSLALNSWDAVGLINSEREILPDNFAFGRFSMLVVTLADFIFMIFLILGILLEDPPLGTRSFWRTRPISAGQMLVAKALCLFLMAWPLQASLQVFINLTAKVEYPWYSDLPTLTAYQATWIGVFALIPLLWHKPIVGVLSLIGICVAFFSMLDQIANTRRIATLEVGLITKIDPTVSAAIVMGILFCTTSTVAAWMYHRRKRPIGFLIFGAGLGAIGIVMALFP